ncbi:hypothetical protein BX616_008414, partial [Lobosporangium transversale]
MPIKSWRYSNWFGYHVFQGLIYICRFIPRLLPLVSRFMFWAQQSRPLKRVDDSVQIFNFDCLFSQYTNEWAIPWSRTSEALRALNEFIETGTVRIEPSKRHEKTSSSSSSSSSAAAVVVGNGRPLKIHPPIEIRFVKKDDVWLSPAYGVDSCYIGLIMYRPFGKPVSYRRFWNGFEKIMGALEGRPHWAKAHSVPYKDLLRAYPKMKEFSEIRQKLDPE